MPMTVLGDAAAISRLALAASLTALGAEHAKEELKTDIANEARGTVAVDTGETQESITETDVGVEASSAALYLEFGTSKMASQPFMRPAADGAGRFDIASIVARTLLGGL